MRTRKVLSELNSSSEYNSLKVSYENEVNEDERIHKIKGFCFAYLDDSAIAESLSADDVKDMRDFIEDKFIYFKQIQKSFKLDYYCTPLTGVSKILDAMILSEDLESRCYDKNKELLQKDLTYTMELMGMMYGILDKLLIEKIKNKLIKDRI